MTQKQYDKHSRENLNVRTAVLDKPELERTSSGLHFTAPDSQWVSRKQRATQFGDNKHGANTQDWPTNAEKDKRIVEPVKELLPESVQSFLDKHVISILSQDEVGQAFLKELKEKANGFTKEVIPDESTPTA